ncbi:ABC-type transport auxiliary lipoprotein family protein [Rhodovarius lipocyclicus]|uniref:ABC-type transport auxiliary lipoprotein family protein n=1 Tax=Rhodovarius lipocyclicus TaxID=268410 RepID=UPI00135CCEF1|nr:ABC-type transport auxiliary lipoprotein family protein [Rhodovarius lipocyclicus]
MRRRALLALALLPGCSVLPERPYVETRRFPLAPQRPASLPAAANAPALLLRAVRPGAGMDGRALRSIRADGTLALAPYAEWAAPPNEAVESSLRQWLQASGLFSAVTAPASRLPSSLVLEVELTALETQGGQARAAFSALLIEDGGLVSGRLRGQFAPRGQAPVRGEGDAAAAEAMSAALADAFRGLEMELGAALGRRRA